MDLIDYLLWGAYPRMGEVRHYRVVSEDDFELVPKKSYVEKQIKALESQIEIYKNKREQIDESLKVAEEELRQKQKQLK